MFYLTYWKQSEHTSQIKMMSTNIDYVATYFELSSLTRFHGDPKFKS